MACFIAVLGNRLNALTAPYSDLLQLTIRLLLISEGLARTEASTRLDGVHYLLGMGFEQSGALLSRFFSEGQVAEYQNPMANDHWYRLLLAFLHYLAGGYRVQALGVLKHLERIAGSNSGEFNLYRADFEALQRFYRDTNRLKPIGQIEQWLLEDTLPENIQGQHINLLASNIRRRRDIVLSNLGRGQEVDWLASRAVNSSAVDFWVAYLNRLEERGITTFTNQQAGDGNQFDWLQLSNDLLVILPTGSGKTIIGELRTALILSENKHVIWLLPTRALVRQTTITMQRAFDSLEVIVEELPTTEDPIPLFTENLSGQKHLAVTTPEKFSSFIRANQEGLKNIGLVVVDEAQLLLEKGRGTILEFVLRRVKQLNPQCNFILMTAFNELEKTLEVFLHRLNDQAPTKLISDTRLTRRVYGTLTNERSTNDGKYHPFVLLFPPGIQTPKGKTSQPYTLFCKETLPSDPGPTSLAQKFVGALTQYNLRSVMFVERVTSTETQALLIAKRQAQTKTLPQEDITRLQIELGRKSVIEETGEKGVVPHHGGLTKLEQAIAEKWVLDYVVQTVVATSTLARGVNLPFDFSIVAYTSRSKEPLSKRSYEYDWSSRACRVSI